MDEGLCLSSQRHGICCTGKSDQIVQSRHWFRGFYLNYTMLEFSNSLLCQIEHPNWSSIPSLYGNFRGKLPCCFGSGLCWGEVQRDKCSSPASIECDFRNVTITWTTICIKQDFPLKVSPILKEKGKAEIHQFNNSVEKLPFLLSSVLIIWQGMLIEEDILIRGRDCDNFMWLHRVGRWQKLWKCVRILAFHL